MAAKIEITRGAEDGDVDDGGDSTLSSDVLKRGAPTQPEEHGEPSPEETDDDPESPLLEQAGGPEGALDDDDVEDETWRPDTDREANGPLDRVMEPAAEKSRAYNHDD